MEQNFIPLSYRAGHEKFNGESPYKLYLKNIKFLSELRPALKKNLLSYQ